MCQSLVVILSMTSEIRRRKKEEKKTTAVKYKSFGIVIPCSACTVTGYVIGE